MKSTKFVLPLVIASIAGIAASTAVAAAKKPAKEWTCADFLAIDDEYQPKAVYWATAYSKRGEPQDSMLDIEGTERVTPMVISECKKAPRESFLKKLKDGWHKTGMKTKEETEKLKEKL